MIILYYVINDPLFWILIFLSISIICVCKLYNAQIIGWFGELWTKQELYKLPSDKYAVLNNILIKVDDKTCQIDHIVISKYGIFVIETKQYNGYITGNKYDIKWVRHYGKDHLYYSNPIRQNYGHIKSLSKLLNIEESKFYNIVCIPSRAILNIKHDGELVRNYTLLDRITSYNNEIIQNADEIIELIKTNNITNYEIRKKHVQNLHKFSKQNDYNKCPRCGGQLVKRTGRYNSFFGCSNYPKCNYIRNI